MKDISIGDNILDSRDVIKKFVELNDELETLKQVIVDAYGDWDQNRDDEDIIEALKQSVVSLQDWSDWDDYKQWKEFCEQGESIPDWTYGETLILDDYFVTYAEQLADDIGAVSSQAEWPTNFIDWERAADQLKMDYTAIEIDGTRYWGRS